jgi:DNA-binding NarL/FixJ family response regulator
LAAPVRIKILIADPQGILREGLAALLAGEPDMQVVGQTNDGLDAVRLADGLRPDIVLLDVALPSLNGIDATRRIRETSSGSKVVCLTSRSEKRLMAEMIDAGAAGYILKDSAFQELANAIRTVMGGGRVVSPELANVVLPAGQPGTSAPARSSPFLLLSPREREVLQLLSEGKNAKEIAGMLQLSRKTVEAHRTNIMEKLEIRTVAGLTRYAIREGLSSLDS